MKSPVCAVSGAQYLTSTGWSELRSSVDLDVPFRLFRDEGRTFLQVNNSFVHVLIKINDQIRYGSLFAFPDYLCASELHVNFIAPLTFVHSTHFIRKIKNLKEKIK